MEGEGYFTNLLQDGLHNEINTEIQQTLPINDSNPSSKANQKHKEKNSLRTKIDFLFLLG